MRFINENELYGSGGIAPTRNCTHFLKILFVVAGGVFYSNYIDQGNKSDKERKFLRKSKVLYIQKDLVHFLKSACHSVWVQFHVYRIIDNAINKSLWKWKCRMFF